jgi:hypothetical protein
MTTIQVCYDNKCDFKCVSVKCPECGEPAFLSQAKDDHKDIIKLEEDGHLFFCITEAAQCKTLGFRHK